MIIENCKDYYGFLNGFDIVAAGKLTEDLRAEALDAINNITIAGNVVEEIIRRNGEFFTGKEASAIAPWNITQLDVFYARYKYYDHEERPENPDFQDYDWCILSIPQYMYGIYLKKKLEAGELTLKDFQN